MKFKIIGIILTGLLFIQCNSNTQSKNNGKIELAKPTPQQLAFMDMEVGAFIHFGLNVYTGQEHGDGFEPATKFNPTELDAEQWIKAAKAMGAKYAVLTVRHEGGFCLWPTKTTEYSISSSPYKNGKGDLMQEFADACRKYGLKVGVYHTASHDAHHLYRPKDKGNVVWGKAGLSEEIMGEWSQEQRDEYIQRQADQMTELLTNYGEITYVWCDHYNGKTNKPEDDAYQKTVRESWRQVTDVMRKLQPNCLMMGPDTWVPGNESGYVVYPMWNAIYTEDGTHYARPKATKADATVPNDYGLLETTALTGHPLGNFWRSRECTTNGGFHYGGWFWHPDAVKPTYAKTLSEHLNLYYRTVGLGANTIINLPPDQSGLLPDDIVKAAEVFGAEIEKRFSNPIAKIDEVIAGKTVELSWDKPKEINTVMLMENIANGQKIVKYTLEAYLNGAWKKIKHANKFKLEKPYNPKPGYETIGHKKIDRIEPVTTNKIRFRCLESVVDDVEIRHFSVYNCDPIDKQYD